MLANFYGLEANGVYSAAYKFSNICVTLFSIFSLTWTESAVLHFNDSDKDDFYSKIFNETFKIFSCLCLGIIAIMSIVFKFVIVGDSYAEAYYQIPILLIATVFNIVVSMYGSVYVATKNSKKIAITSIYSAIINILVNLSLIKIIGLYAASISTLVAYFAMSIYRFFDTNKYVKIKWDFKYLISFTFITALIIIIYYLGDKLMKFVGLIGVIFYSIYFNIIFINKIALIIKNKLRGLSNEKK